MLRDGAIATWSEEVLSSVDLREGARQTVADAFKVFPFCVWSPAFAGNYGRSRSTYLCLGDGKVGIVRAEGRNPRAIFVQLSEIDALETGTELLSSWIAFHFRGQRAAVYFNTVSRSLYMRLVNAYRAARELTGSAENGAGSTPEDLERYFAGLRKVDFKYDNYARLALENRLPSTSFYHPATEIARSIFGARAISSYLLVAARGLLYSFSEARIIRYARAANYSMVIRYIPIDASLSCRLSEMKAGYVTRALAKSNAPLLEIPVASEESEKFQVFRDQSGISMREE